MDNISLIESADPSFILLSDNSDLLDELIEDIFDSTFFDSTFFDSTFTWPWALRYPTWVTLPHPLPQLSLHIRPLNLRGAAETTLVSTLEAAPSQSITSSRNLTLITLFFKCELPRPLLLPKRPSTTQSWTLPWSLFWHDLPTFNQWPFKIST